MIDRLIWAFVYALAALVGVHVFIWALILLTIAIHS